MVTERIYDLVLQLPRFDFQSMENQVPPDGIYAFFERSETVSMDCASYPRVTRIGTHIKPGRLPQRVQQHFGNKRSLGGSKNASVFRKHLGGAILRRNNPNDHRIEGWITQGGPSIREIEEEVSRILRMEFSFVCIPINEYEDRKRLSRGLIALLSHLPVGAPSENWLGNFAAAKEIRSSGLWNVEHVHAEPLGNDEVDELIGFAHSGR